MLKNKTSEGGKMYVLLLGLFELDILFVSVVLSQLSIFIVTVVYIVWLCSLACRQLFELCIITPENMKRFQPLHF